MAEKKQKRIVARPRIDARTWGRGPARLREWRYEQNPLVSLQALSDRLGFSQYQKLQRYETATGTLSMTELVLLAAETGIPARELARPDQLQELERLELALQRATRGPSGKAEVHD